MPLRPENNDKQIGYNETVDLTTLAVKGKSLIPLDQNIQH